MSAKFDTILIVGGTSGIGEGIARRFHATGKKVIVTGRRQDRLDALEKELPGLSTQRMDTEDIATLPKQVSAVLAAHPELDTVIAMAGIQKSFSFTDPKASSPESIQSEVTTNVTAPMVLAQLLVPHLLSLQRPTTFVLVSSGLAFVPVPFYPVYCPTKAAIHSFAIALRAQLAGTSCDVIELAPPYVETGLDDAHREQNVAAQGGPEKAMKPMPLEEYLDTAMAGFEGGDREIATGFSQMGASAWRKTFGPIMKTLNKYAEVYHEQPRPTSALVFDFDNVRPCSHASRPSQWMAESRSHAFRASRRASSATRRSTSRRPTIGAPSEFRRVEQRSGRDPSFRPLQLSIYLPGNELPSLPTFREEEEEDNAGLTYPAQVLVKSRSDSMLSRPSTAFSIPRKPVPKRAVSTDQARYSTESRFTFNETSSGGESRSAQHRPSLGAARQSTQDFLDALDTRLPQAPPALRSNSGPEPVYTLYRRASEQSLRLRTHLEERSQIERSLPEFGSIPEERQDSSSKSKGLSPILDRDEITPADDLLGNRGSDHTRSNSSPSLASSRFHLRSSVATPVPAPIKPSQCSVVSQWLLRSVGSQASLRSDWDSSAHGSTQDCTGHPQCTFRDRSSTASSTIYSSSTAADLVSSATTPYSSPHKKIDSVSTYHTVSIPRVSYDWKKRPVMVDVKPKAVGMAL
ncbi:MAG: hypothetical protein Q9173_004125 [Seirophora scorigena]